jgi:hypothetical protein
MRCCWCDADFETKPQALDHDCDENPTVFVGEVAV